MAIGSANAPGAAKGGAFERLSEYTLLTLLRLSGIVTAKKPDGRDVNDYYYDMLIAVFRIVAFAVAERKGLLRAPFLLRDTPSYGELLESCLLIDGTQRHSDGFFAHGRTSLLNPIMTGEDIGFAVSGLRSLMDEEQVGSELLGDLFEAYYGKRLISDGTSLEDTIDRKDNGVYYTPQPLAEFTVRKSLERYSDLEWPALLELRILDPAMGPGKFLLETLRQLMRISGKQDGPDVKSRIAIACLHGVDKDPLAVEIAKVIMWLEVGDARLTPLDFNGNLQCGDSLLADLGDGPASEPLEPDSLFGAADGRFDWRSSFPDVFYDVRGDKKVKPGFHIIVGNPPWGKIKPNIKEYYTYLDKAVHGLQGASLREHVKHDRHNWTDYEQSIKRYSELIRTLPTYADQKIEVNGKATGGDWDLYKLFVELSYRLLHPEGRLGFIVPSSFYMAEGAAGIRKLLLDNGAIDYLVNFENRKKIFPIHGSFKFAVFIYERGHGSDGSGVAVRRALFNVTDLGDLSEARFNKHSFIGYERSFLGRTSSGFLSVPEAGSPAEVPILERMYASFPMLGEHRADTWNVSFKRELDMTNDSGKFVTLSQLQAEGRSVDEIAREYVSVFEGRMVHQFDYAAKAYLEGEGRTAKWEELELSGKRIQPHYFLPRRELPQGEALPPRAGFCDVTGQKNERTVLATLVPANCVCGNKVPTLRFDSGKNDIRLDLLWIGIANSFAVDWIIRKKVTTTLNFFHWEQVPFPRISPDEAVAREIILHTALLVSITDDADLLWEMLGNFYSSGELDDFRKRSRIEAERAASRLKIDSLVAGLYELSLEELALILHSFPILDRGQPPIPGDTAYSGRKPASCVTRDCLLHDYAMQMGAAEVDIVDLYDAVGIDLRSAAGAVRLLRERVAAYGKLGAVAYT